MQSAKVWEDVSVKVDDGLYVISYEHNKRIVRSVGTVPVSHGRRKKHVWPLYSLQPGIDRASTVTGIGNFHAHQNRNPYGKVDGSEFNFSHRWYCQGFRKGLLRPYKVYRMHNHKSTKELLRNL